MFTCLEVLSTTWTMKKEKKRKINQTKSEYENKKWREKKISIVSIVSMNFSLVCYHYLYILCLTEIEKLK